MYEYECQTCFNEFESDTEWNDGCPECGSMEYACTNKPPMFDEMGRAIKNIYYGKDGKIDRIELYEDEMKDNIDGNDELKDDDSETYPF
jgi:predicted  nucleic acid-binding Zn-ribbon protein